MALGKGLGAFFSTPNGTATKMEEVQVKDEVTQKNDTSASRPHDIVRYVPLSAIRANPNQPRKTFRIDELQELVASIETHGVLQPIVVTETSDGSYEIIAGERRFRACQMIGMATIPAVIRPVDERTKLELALIENIQRAELNAVEEAYAYKRLCDEFNDTQEEVAARVGKSRTHVANMIRLLDLPQDIQRGLIEGKISHTKARALLGLPTIASQLKAYFDMLGDKTITTRETESMVRMARTSAGRRNPLIDEIESRLRGRMGTKVYVTNNHGRGSIKIEFYSDEEFKKILGLLE